MASSLSFLTSKLITRSIVWFSPTFASSSRLFSIIARHRSYTSMPKDDFYDQSWPRILSPKISSMSFDMNMTAENRNLTLYTPEYTDRPDYNGVFVELDMPGLEKKEMRACVEHDTLFVQRKTDNKCCLAGVMLPDNINNSGIMEEMKDGMLEVTLPDKEDIMAKIITNIITSFQDICAKRSWIYYDMFYDRSILGEGLCHALAMLSPVNSFSIYKKETAKKLDIDMNMPGKKSMKLTTQGIHLSLNMRGLKRKDIKIFFDYNTLFIEGKSKELHYITCIRLPEGIRKKHNMIKRQMHDGSLYAFIPCVKKEYIKIN